MKFDQNKKQFSSLNKVILVMFLQDETIYPMCSPQFCGINDSGHIVPMEQTPEYIGDYFGLKTLNEAGKIIMKTVDAGHINL